MSSNLSPHDKLAAARLAVRERAPYIQSALFALVVHEAPGLGTVGVTENGILMVDYGAVANWTVEETAAALYHEVWHVLRDHISRGKAAGAHPFLFNLAGDAEINDDIREAGGWACGDDWIYPEKIGCEEGLTAEEYYGHIRQNLECSKCGKQIKPPDDDQNSTGQSGDGSSGQSGVDSQASDKGDGDGESDESKSSKSSKGKKGGKGGKQKDSSANKPGSGSKDGGDKGHCECGSGSGMGAKPGPGWCGSGAGRKLPGEPESTSGKGEGEGDGDSKGGGEDYGKVRGRTKAELDRVRREVARSAQDHSEKSRGTVPGGILRWAGDILKPPRIRWQDKLARFTRSAVAYRAGAVDYKYERPSRRQYGTGFGYGKPIFPCMRQPVPNVLVVVDTSGSMGQGELKTALQETNGVLMQTGAKVQFMSCDAAVHGIGEVRNWRDMLPLLKGGGGTSFCPAFEAIPKCKPKPDVIIFVTDGCGDAPATPPPGIKVIWLLVGSHKQEPYFGSYGNRTDNKWGDMIYMEDEVIVEDLEDAA